MNEVLALSVGVGAVIGYVTNYVAIKLLFRPYKPVKIGNITIFPAGVIPREKKALAKKVGDVVNNYILSHDEIKKIVTSDEVKKELESFLDKKIEFFLSQNITNIVPKEEFAKNLALFVDEIIQNKFPMFASFLNQDQIYRLFVEMDLDLRLDKFVNKNIIKQKLMVEIEKFLENELPEILLKAKIDKIVEEKVSSFDEKRLEDMLFVLMKKHFGFINLAGAVLGGVIGLIQYLIMVKL
jgi:uncharacterized membrane protein YheB (UPF0754 family)